ncbi:MAG TPA: RNA-binding cell elongation regulator Jag/EloR [Thermomicrobiales bacterium]|nr:RNA-binding cell elongation regulator Jag/EloR [Thermomicrobiales bacterium]
MMQQRTSVEIQAVSVDEAVRLALAELALTHDDVDIEILSDAGPDEDAEALVRVTAKGQASQPIAGSRASTTSPITQPRERGSRPRRRGRGGEGGSGEWLRGRSRPGERPSHRGAPPKRASVERVDAEDERIAKEIVIELLRHMGVTADVMVVDNPSIVPPDEEEPPTIFIDILGKDLGMLIGRRGDHLSQIQYLISMLVNQRLETWTRVIIDVEGYRSRREESLIGLAERVARQVSRSRQPIDLEPMPPNERRIIHLTLRSHPGVSTHSSGEGNHRHITVEPIA